ncbi:MAG: hypothetical protein ABSE73_05440 [Planctomycetota bacterium]
MTTLQCADVPGRKGHLFIAAGLLLLGGIATSYWIADAFPDSRRRPRSALTQGEPINSAAPMDGTSRNPDAHVVIEGGDSDYATVTFDLLGSFFYEIRRPGATHDALGLPLVQDQIPAPIKILNHKRVAVQGFMYVDKISGERVRTFWLVKDRSKCCFGKTPRMNEWIDVRMKEGRFARPINDQVITVFGVLEIGEVYENGQLQSIYRMEAHDVALAPGI